MSSIAEVQEQKEREIKKKYRSIDKPQDGDLDDQETVAARVLQKNYRGYRARRALKGLNLDPSSRWVEAVKEAQYRDLTTPRPRSSKDPEANLSRTTSAARQNWSRAGKIARRAGHDEESSLSSSSLDNDTLSSSKTEAHRRKRLAQKQEQTKSAKIMDLSYFLEMVDLKHRYGSNLRKYHTEWKSRSTNENFFYWLDQGEGKHVEVEKCSRERLENMQVRYLGREERRYYEVIVDKEGKLCWRKDGIRVDTTDRWRDSVRGIVKVGDPAPAWAHRPAMLRGSSESSEMSSEETSNMWSPTAGAGENNEPQGMMPPTPSSPLTGQPPPRHSSFHDLFRKPSEKSPAKKQPKKKKQKWIFVADANNNLYIGIKQAGAFQHSSFLHGGRVSAAGLITVRDGQLRILQPRSGHYKTPSHNLRIFIKSLQSRHVDMSMTAVGGSYAAMVGIETFMKTRGKLRGLKEGLRSLSLKTGEEEKGEKV